MLIVTRNHFDGPKARKVASTGDLPPETALERAAHELYDKNAPQVGVTLEDILTLPPSMQACLGFQVQEFFLPIECREYDKPIADVPKAEGDKILVIKDQASNLQAYLKRGINPFAMAGYPLERAAYEYRRIDPDDGEPLTYGEALNVPADFLAEHQIELVKLPGPVEIRYSAEYLVKPLQAQEQEIAAYIQGCLCTLCGQKVLAKSELDSCGSLRRTARHWAHEYLQRQATSLDNFIRQKIDDI